MRALRPSARASLADGSAGRYWRAVAVRPRNKRMELQPCPGCGGCFAGTTGATHPSMLLSPGCWGRFGEVLAREYSHSALLATHRLSVDTYAVQHPGSTERRAVQSIGLHLARLMIQLRDPAPPRETNDIMLGLSQAKASLPYLEPPKSYALTVADIPLAGPLAEHIAAVHRWAAEAWAAWQPHHKFIESWVETVQRRL